MLSDPRFIIGAILAAAVLAVSSFALYATIKVMQQAKAGVMESSRTPPFAAGEDWHRYQSAGPNPGPGDKAVPPGAVSILLNALPKTTQPSPLPIRPQSPPASPPGTMDAPVAAEPLDTAPLGPASTGGENAAAAESALASTPAEGERSEDTSASETVTGTVAAPAAQEEAAPPVSEEIPARLSPRRPAAPPGRRVKAAIASRQLARERDNEPAEPPPRRRAVRVVEHRPRAYARPLPYQPARRSLYGGNYWQPFGAR
jgi:hypothetical protein